MKQTILLLASLLMLAACNGQTAQRDSVADSIDIAVADSNPVKKQTLIIDVETLTPPKGPIATVPYNKVLRNLLNELTNNYGPIIAHTRQTRPLVESNHPFFYTMYRAYADHRPVELSPEALWLLICQGFSLHVNNNAEELRSLFVDFEGKRTLAASSQGIHLDDPNSPWERVFPQFTSQIAAYTGQELIDVLAADFTTSTPASRVASQITVMESMKQYFDYLISVCGIPQVILHGTPED